MLCHILSSSIMPWACCITSGRMTDLPSARCSTSSPSLVSSLPLPIACSSGSPANCWMRQREGEWICCGHTRARGPLQVGGVIVCLYVISHDSPLFDFIESCLRNKNEMVVYEAASAIVHMPNCTARELAPAVSGQFAVQECLISVGLCSECNPYYSFVLL